MRKKIIAAGVILGFCFSLFAYADEKEPGLLKEKRQEFKLSGVIIDNRSVEKYMDQMLTFAPRYSKMQAVIPISYESGYSIYTSDDELYKFSKEANDKIFEFLQDRDNVLKVVVIVYKDTDGQLELISIKNRYRGARGEEN